MKGQIKVSYVLGVLGFISLGNYVLLNNPEMVMDEVVLLSSLCLIIIFYLFFLRRIKKSQEKIAMLSSSIQENIYFRNNNTNRSLPDEQVISSYVEDLLSDIRKAKDFVKDVTDGNLTSDFAVNEEELSRNELLKSLSDLRAKLVHLDEEEQERKWVSDGMTRFVEILRRHHQSAEEFYDSIITGIVKYLNANQGSLFLYSENEEGKKVLKQVACYAYNRKKYLEKEVQPGQGLVGQVYLEKETIFLTEIPQDYISITSGLGEARPRNLLLVPFKLNDKVECVIELASFHNFKSYQIGFLEKVGESIASTISSYKINERTKKLLEDSQHQAEIMQAQEEELRQNMEELEATQENLQRESQEKATIQAEIIKTRDFLQKVMNAIPDPIFVKDKAHKITLVNDAFCVSTGLCKEEVLGKNEYDLYTKEEADAFYHNDEQLFLEKSEFTKEEKVAIGGKDIFRITKKRIIEDEDGNRFLVGINHDITHIKEVEQELAKEKYLMDALMKNASDLIYFKDKDSKFIRMCDAMLHIFNAKSPEEVVGKSDFDFFTEEHARPAFEAEQEIIRTSKPIRNLVEKETWEDGRVTYVSTSKMPLKNLEGENIGTFGISRDVTETKLMEVMMEKREKLLTSLIDYTDEIIMLLDGDLQYQFISPALARTFDLEEDDVIGKRISWFIHSDDEENVREFLTKLKPSEKKRLKFRHIGENGDYIQVQATCTNALEDNSLQGYVCSIKVLS